MTISLSQAFANWQDGGGMGSPADILGKDDTAALSESWNDYTDGLCKDGEITGLQYHHCPAYDDPMPGEGGSFDDLSDDREFILDAMAVKLTSKRRSEMREGWDIGSTHWDVTLSRGSKFYCTVYSMGSALTGAPECDAVLWSLMTDADCHANAVDAMDMAEDMGMSLETEADKRKARTTYAACGKSAKALGEMFTSSEMDDLRELFSNF